ncbi:hypothetical protein BSKO_03147 [Bryopsis sp. KO-2023]|nr:hypothetical protein BSKO_03147 [Bryopsis sp. KO-2023]
MENDRLIDRPSVAPSEELRWKLLGKRYISENGVFLRVLCTLVVFLELVLVKKLRDRVTPFQILVVRAFVTAILLSLHNNKAFRDANASSILGKKESRKLLFATAMLSFFDNACSWLAITRMPIGDATSVLYATPAVTSTVALILGMESWSWTTPVGVVLSILGVVLVARPPMLFHGAGAIWTSDRLVGMGFALLGMLCASGVNLLRKVSGLEKVTVILMWQNIIVALPFSLLFLGVGFPERPSFAFTGLDVFITVLVALGGFYSWMLVFVALRFSSATVVAVLGTLILVWSYIGDVVIFGDAVSVPSLLGAFCIVLASVAVSFAPGAKKSEASDILPEVEFQSLQHHDDL